MMEETLIRLLGKQHKWTPLSSAFTPMLGAGETVSCCACRATVSGVLEMWWDSSKGMCCCVWKQDL